MHIKGDEQKNLFGHQLTLCVLTLDWIPAVYVQFYESKNRETQQYSIHIDWFHAISKLVE